MNSLQIEYFLTICHYMNFTKAAQALYVSQPAISKQISALENELGIALFDRRQRQLRLTHGGQRFRDLFSQIAADIAALQKEIKDANSQREGRISIGLFQDWNPSMVLSNVINAMKTEFPEIDINLESHSINTLLERLNDGSLDVIIAYAPCFENLLNCDTLTFTEVSSRLFYSQNHPLARKKNVSFEDFTTETFFVEEKKVNSLSLRRLNECCSAYGFLPKVKICPNTASIISSVHLNLGVALFDNMHKISLNPGFKYLDLDICTPIAVAWDKKNTSSSVGAFVNQAHLSASPSLL